MIYSNRLIFFSLILASLFFFSACSFVEDIDKIKEPEWHPEIAVALVHSEFSLGDILDHVKTDGLLTVDAEGLLGISYEDSLHTITADQMLTFQDLPVPMIDTAIAVPVPSQNGEQISRLSLKAGVLTYSFNSPHNGDIRVIMQMPNAAKNGVPFSQIVTVNSPSSQSGSFDLAGYQFDFSDGLIEFSYRAILVSTGQRVTLDNFLYRLSSVQYDFAEGFLGQFSFAVDAGSVDMNLFDEWATGAFQLEEPSLRLLINNSMGVPVSIRAETLEMQTHSEGAISINTTALNNGILINYPTLANVGESRSTTISIDHTNSNLPQALAGNPYAFAFDFDATAFPDNDPAQTGFITDESTMEVSVSAEFPLYGSLKDLAIRDTIEMELDDLDELSTAGFKLLTENGFPLSIAMQLYFLDDRGATIDSLNETGSLVLNPAETDNNGRATTPTEDVLSVSLSESRLAAIRSAHSIAIEAILDSPEAGTLPVKLYEDYQLKLRFGVTASL